jgi:magnesium chelatase accessory protein
MTRPSSQFVEAEGLNWYVETMGRGEIILLIHGTAASVHSWRDVMPILAEQFQVVALDLPGHGKTIARDTSYYRLERMASGASAVMKVLKLSPAIVAGHSAGAAIMALACARKMMQPQSFVSFNGAFYPYGGAAGSLFSPIAKLAAFNGFVPRLLSGFATRSKVEKLLQDTGSHISPEGVDFYFNLFKQPSHVAAALGMMASWDLRGMEDNFVRMTQSCTFVAGADDKAVPPETADRAAKRCRNARTMHIKGLGHLLHEENPALAAEIVRGAKI